MKITALEIQQKEFAKAFRGYAAEEVRPFLEQVARQMEELVRENIGLKEDLQRRDERIAALEARARLLEETLVSAQRMSDDLKAQARSEAENIVAEAELRAEIIVQQANERLVEVVGQINEMKRQRALFAAQLRQAAEAQIALLDAMAQETGGAGRDDEKKSALPRASGEE